MPYANNKGADQPAHLRCLISTFVVRCLDSIIPLVSTSKISSLYIASVAAQSGLYCALPGRKPRRQVFSCRGSLVFLALFSFSSCPAPAPEIMSVE